MDRIITRNIRRRKTYRCFPLHERNFVRDRRTSMNIVNDILKKKTFLRFFDFYVCLRSPHTV